MTSRLVCPVALAPSRDGVLLPRNQRKPLPDPDALVSVPVVHEEGGLSASGCFGRQELRLAHWQTCPCQCVKDRQHEVLGGHSRVTRQRTRPRTENFDKGPSQPSRNASGLSSSPQLKKSSKFCNRCEFPWSKCMGRKFLKLSSCDVGNAIDTHQLGQAKIWVKARRETYPVLERILVNDTRLGCYGLQPDGDNRQSRETPSEAWLSPLDLNPGDTITFCPYPAEETDGSQNLSMEFTVIKNPRRRSTELQERSITEVPKPHVVAKLSNSSRLNSSADSQSTLKTQLHESCDVQESDPLFPHFFQSSQSQEVGQTKSQANHPFDHPKIYLVKCNRHTDMFNKMTRERIKRKAICRGATVLDKFDRNDPPTHIIVGNALRMDEVDFLIGDLDFASVQELQGFMEEHSIVFARIKWIMKKDDSVFGPVEDDETYKLAAKRATEHNADRSHVADGEQLARKRHKQAVQDDSQSHSGKNAELSDLFSELSKLYREAPLEDHDLWRAYTFSKAASIMRHLTFQVTFESVDELKQQSGLKDSCVNIAKEYLTTGKCERLRSLLADKQRIAMRDFTRIWGAGPKRAKELIAMGYHDIKGLRRATASGQLLWQRNEYIGLKYYEDINDEMDRLEAKQIVDIVTELVNSKDFYPTAMVMPMGSYRRMKPTCGDVDFIITDPAWVEEVPPTFLGRLVDKLRHDGHILHHLTLIRGMDPNCFETLDTADLKFIKPQTSDTPNKKSKKKKNKRSYTWMGIFRSPASRDKTRRVDIKVYPYANYIYASLYFTGNGHFNRAMRFFSKKRKNPPRYQLDDHGLWVVGNSGNLIIDDDGDAVRAKNEDGSAFVPQTEKDVFDKLGLVWKEPHERDGFGALQVKDEKGETDLNMTFADILSDAHDFYWIN